MSTTSCSVTPSWGAICLSWGRAGVTEPTLPLAAAFAFIAQGRVEGGVAAEPAVHVHHILLGHAKLGGDLLDMVRVQVAFLEGGDAALGLAQVEEQLLLV